MPERLMMPKQRMNGLARVLLPVAFGFAALVLIAPVSAAQIAFEPLPVVDGEEPPLDPIRGRPTRIVLEAPTERVEIIWRPSSAIPDTVPLDPTGMAFEWTPTRAGVARVVTAEGVAQNVSVRYDEYPGSGIFILILAATILFGGAGFALGRLLGSDAPRRPNLADT